MSNTYFKLHKEIKTLGHEIYPDYTNEYNLTLTAFVGKEEHLQMTIQTKSTIPGQSGIAFITLSNDDIDKLIAGLLERKLGRISATGDEQSSYCPNN